MSNSDLAVRIDNLTKKYGRVLALDNVSFTVRAGEIFGVLGRNGAGKTTLLEILEGLRTGDGGEVRVLGFDPRTSLKAIKERIGIQLQSSSFFRKLRVVEVIKQFHAYYKNRVEVDELLRQVALHEKRNSFIEDLSGGQRQRLALALALVNNPAIIFLDEPTAGLDAQIRRQLWHTIQQLKSSGKTVLLTTHYIEEAERLCDRVAILEHGRMLVAEPPAEIIKRMQGGATYARLTTRSPISFEGLKSVTPVEYSQNGISSYVARIADTGPAIVELITAIERQSNSLLEFQITRATLEDAFIELTGKEIQP